MKRVAQTPRPDWSAKADAVGFTYHTAGHLGAEGARWDEVVAYEFTAAQIDTIEAATNDLHQLCLTAVECVLSDDSLLRRFAIDRAFWPMLRSSWAWRDPHVYGRMDLAFDPTTGGVKLLEYNADTPTTLIESAVVQWFWMKDVHPHADQFNSIHERLIARWREVSVAINVGRNDVHFSAWGGSEEEVRTVEYMAETARQAGISVNLTPIEKVEWDHADGRFCDAGRKPIDHWFKLYPWEWLMVEGLGSRLTENAIRTIFEPAWKMLLSNKAILPVLWKLFPGHSLLLESYFNDEIRERRFQGDWVIKPILGREGANIQMRVGEGYIVTRGDYGHQPVIHQRVAPLPCFDGHHAVIGSWVVGDEAAGMIVREDRSPIITGNSSIVPHYFIPEEQ